MYYVWLMGRIRSKFNCVKMTYCLAEKQVKRLVL